MTRNVYQPLQYIADRQISPGLTPSLSFLTSLSPTTWVILGEVVDRYDNENDSNRRLPALLRHPDELQVGRGRFDGEARGDIRTAKVTVSFPER